MTGDLGLGGGERSNAALVKFTEGIFLNHEQLLVGWLLGMLSPAVIEGIRRRRRLKLLERAIALELHEV